MAPKAKAKGKAKAKATPAAAQQPPAPAPSPEASTSDSAVNARIIAEVNDAKIFLEGLPPFNDMISKMPGDGGIATHQVPYDSDRFVNSLKDVGLYVCCGNLWWVSPFMNVQPSVPLNIKSIQTLKEQFFALPPNVFPDTVTVAVLDTEAPSFGQLVKISPEESITDNCSGLSTTVSHAPPI